MLRSETYRSVGLDPDHVDSAMGQAFFQAMRSEDPSSQTGAVIMDQGGRIFGKGFNAPPEGVSMTPEQWADRELKLQMVEHAERNAIAHMARFGKSIIDCTMVSPWIGCAPCDRLIIQSGIKNIIRFPVEYSTDHWGQSIKLGDEMLQEAGVQIFEDNFSHLKLPTLRRGGKMWVPGEQ